jgi:hypothetical protein
VNLYTNLGNVGSLYALELIATSGAAGAIRADLAFGRGALATRALNLTAAGLSKAATIQKVFLATGLNYFPLSTLADTALRTMGNKEGVAYLDRINRTTLISDSPAVQLVSSFSVNPIAASKLAFKGQLKFLGSPLVAVDLATGRRFSRLYNHDTIVLDRLAEMYNTNRAGAAELIGPGRFYETKGAAYNEILNLAADSFVQKLPESTKSIINALPFGQRTTYLFSRYASQVLDEVEKPLGMIARWRRDWSYHKLYGEFDPQVAGHVSVDYRAAQLKNAMAREGLDLVTTYPTLLNPEGQQIVAAEIEAAFANGRQGILRDLNMLSEKHPALNGLVDDLVAKGPYVKPKDAVPREVFDEALARATAAWDDAKLSPFRTVTGGDPILRPTARPAEWADALGTSEDTVEALTSATRTPAQDGLIAGFLRERKLATEAELTTLGADDLYAKAYREFERLTDPWVQRGADVAATEARSAVVGETLARLRRDRVNGVSVSQDEMMAAKEEYDKLQALLSDVRDPGVPYAATLKFAERPEARAVAEARRVLEARERAAVVKSVQEAIAPVPVFGTNDLLLSVEKVGGSWGWKADRWTTSRPLFDAASSRRSV